MQPDISRSSDRSARKEPRCADDRQADSSALPGRGNGASGHQEGSGEGTEKKSVLHRELSALQVTIESPVRLTQAQIFDRFRELYLKDVDLKDIQDILQLGPHKFKIMLANVKASLTINDYNWSPDARRAYVRSRLNKIAAENDGSSDPDSQKLALSALKEIARDSEVGILRKDSAVAVDFSKVGKIAPVSLESIIDVGGEE